MLDEIKKPPAPSPPSASARTSDVEKSPKSDKSIDLKQETNSISKFSIEKSSCTIEKSEKLEEKSTGTLERRIHSMKTDKEGSDVLIAQLNDRVSPFSFMLYPAYNGVARGP